MVQPRKARCESTVVAVAEEASESASVIGEAKVRRALRSAAPRRGRSTLIAAEIEAAEFSKVDCQKHQHRLRKGERINQAILKVELLQSTDNRKQE